MKTTQDVKLQLGILFLALLAGAISAQAQNAPVAPRQNPVPQINQPLVPEAALPGSSGLTLTVNGAGFVRRSEVMWNGERRPTKFVNSTQLLAKTTNVISLRQQLRPLRWLIRAQVAAFRTSTSFRSPYRQLR